MFKRTFLFLYRKPMQTLTLFLLLLMVFTLEFSGILLYQSAQDCREDTLRQIGAKITVGNSGFQKDSFTPMTKEILNSVLKIPHVIGYDGGDSKVAGNCLPISFKNVKKHTGVDPETQTTETELNALKEQNYVYLHGSNAIDLCESFRKHLSTVTSGDFPTDSNRGVLISRELAEANGLKVGDEIRLQFVPPSNWPVSPQEKSLRIRGIYDTALKFEILPENDMSVGVYNASPYNRIFADYATASSVTGHDGKITFFSIYIDSPENIDSVSKAVKGLPIDWKQYALSNDTQLFYNDYAGQLNKLIDHSSNLIIFSLIIGTVLFLFVASFWNKNYMNDMGILISLGEKKRKIVLQRLLECSMIAAAAMLLSIFLGRSILSALLARLTPKPVSINAENVITSFLTGEYDIVQKLNVVISGESILKIVVMGIILLLIFSVLPTVLAMRYNSRQIFQKTE